MDKKPGISIFNYDFHNAQKLSRRRFLILLSSVGLSSIVACAPISLPSAITDLASPEDTPTPKPIPTPTSIAIPLPNEMSRSDYISKWKPVTIDEAIIHEINALLRPLPQGYEQYEVALKNSLQSIGLSISEVSSLAWEYGETTKSYAWTVYARNASDDIIWRMNESKTEGPLFADFPVLFLDDLVLEKDGVLYETIPNSSDAHIIPGGINGSLPVIVKGIVDLGNERTSYLYYWHKDWINKGGKPGAWKFLRYLGFRNYLAINGSLIKREVDDTHEEKFIKLSLPAERIWTDENEKCAIIYISDNVPIGFIFDNEIILAIHEGKKLEMDPFGIIVNQKSSELYKLKQTSHFDNEKKWFVIAGEYERDLHPLIGVSLNNGEQLPIDEWETVEFEGIVWYWHRLHGTWEDAEDRAQQRLGVRENELSFEGTYEGITIPMRFGVRPELDINKRIEINPDAGVIVPDLYAKMWLICCWQNYRRYINEKYGLSQYLDLVRKGEGSILIAAADILRGDYRQFNSYPMELKSYDPRLGYRLLFTDKVSNHHLVNQYSAIVDDTYTMVEDVEIKGTSYLDLVVSYSLEFPVWFISSPNLYDVAKMGMHYSKVHNELDFKSFDEAWRIIGFSRERIIAQHLLLVK